MRVGPVTEFIHQPPSVSHPGTQATAEGSQIIFTGTAALAGSPKACLLDVSWQLDPKGISLEG